MFISYGIYIFFLLFYFSSEETQLVVSDLNISWLTRKQIGYILIISMFLFIISLYYYLNDNTFFKQHIVNEFIYFIVFLILFNMSSLIVGFALYFVFWHSLPSLQEQQKFLYKNMGFKGFKLYFYDSWKYWFISVIGLIVFSVFLYDYKNLLSILFAFVAAITFPHVVIMHQMFSGKK